MASVAEVVGLFPEAEQGPGLVVEGGARGVEVLRHLGCCSRGASGGEPDQVPVGVADPEGEPAAEPVDQPPGACRGGQAGVEEGLVGEPLVAEVVARWVQPAGA